MLYEVITIALKRFLPRFPYMIGAMLVGSTVSVLLDADAHGIVITSYSIHYTKLYDEPQIEPGDQRVVTEDRDGLGSLCATGLHEHGIKDTEGIEGAEQQRHHRNNFV